MKTKRLAALTAIVAAVAAVPAVANHSWGTYHWATTNGEVGVRVNYALTGPWAGYLITATTQWDQSANLTLSAPVPVSVSRKRCNPIAGQILVCNDAYGPRGWLGIASIWTDSKGHISQGTTKLNDTYYASAQYNTPAWRAMVMCQEVGHDFGLGHVNETFTDPNTGSCMDYTNDPSGTKGTNGTAANIAPNAHDMQQLAIIYGHSDGYTSATASSATNFGVRTFGKPQPAAPVEVEPGESPAEWGAAVHFDGKGRPDIFRQDLPGGGHKITHVFWALETKRSEIHHD